MASVFKGHGMVSSGRWEAPGKTPSLLILAFSAECIIGVEALQRLQLKSTV